MHEVLTKMFNLPSNILIVQFSSQLKKSIV